MAVSARSIRRPQGASFFTLVLLIGPAFILFVLFVVVPVVQATVFSLYKWNGLGPMTNFRGIGNFIDLISDTVFRKALSHNLIIVAVSLAVELPIALGLAIIIYRGNFRLAVLFRTFFFLPFILSEIITGILWQYIYQPQYGLVKTIKDLLNPAATGSIALLGNPQTVLWAILGVIVWKYFGLYMMIYIAGLQDIPVELQEAAQIDGATNGQVFRHVTFPLLATPVQISIFLSIIGSFQIFDVVWAMGKGDPINSAETMVTYLYKFGISRFNIGYGGAVAVVIFLICLTFSALYQKIVVREEQ